MGIDKPTPEAIKSVVYKKAPQCVTHEQYVKTDTNGSEIIVPNYVVDVMRHFDCEGNSSIVKGKPRRLMEKEIVNSVSIERNARISGEVDEFETTTDTTNITKNDVLKFSCKSMRSRREMRKYCIEILKRINQNQPYQSRIRITTQDITQLCNHRRI